MSKITDEWEYVIKGKGATQEEAKAKLREAFEELLPPKAKPNVWDNFVETALKNINTRSNWVKDDPYSVLAPVQTPENPWATKKESWEAKHRREFPNCNICKERDARKAREEAEAKEAEAKAAQKAKKEAAERELARHRTAVAQSMAVVERELNRFSDFTSEQIRTYLSDRGCRAFIATGRDYMAGTALARWLFRVVESQKFDKALPTPVVQTYGGLGKIHVTSGPYSMSYELEGGLAEYLRKYVEGKYSESKNPV